MKKTIALLLALVMLVAIFAACGSSEPAKTPEQNQGQTGVKGPMDDVEPLAEKTKLVVCQLAGGPHSAVSYLIEKLGGYEKANIEIEYAVMPNGNVMVEAVDSWDVATYGVGGIFGGISKDATYILGSTMHDTAFRFFARNDSPIVKEGNTVKEHPSLLGSAATWADKEILLPVGTTQHAFLMHVLGIIGLDQSKVRLTNMDVANTNTAFRAGSGDIAGMWPPQSLATDMDEKFTCIADSTVMGYETGNCMAANINSYNDPKKTKAIEKWVELYYRTSKWMYENDDNLKQAAEWFNEWNESCGAKSDVESSLITLKVTPIYQIEEAVKLFEENVKASDGREMTKMQEMQYTVMQLFISLDKFKPVELDNIAGDKYFKKDYLMKAYELLK